MRHLNLIWILIFTLISCREAYLPELKPTDKQVLVVEGFIKSDKGVTSIRLTRSRAMNDGNPLQVVDGASVIVEGEDQTLFPLINTGNGLYESGHVLFLDHSKRYRVKISTGGKEYLSEFSKVLMTPEIDSISWERDAEGISLGVNTHSTDPSIQYFLWDYIETWEFHSKHESFYRYREEENDVVPRDPVERMNMYICWKHVGSTGLLLGTSSNLEDNIIYNAPLLKIENADQRLSERYSILVHQVALDRSGYDFYQLMKKNTESTGSIFGPQPSEISGNVKCLTNPSELVIGYVGVAAVTEKRIFIEKNEVPGWGYLQPCDEVYVLNHPDSLRLFFPIYIPYQMKGFAEGFYAANRGCIDCTLTGTNNRPSFW